MHSSPLQHFLHLSSWSHTFPHRYCFCAFPCSYHHVIFQGTLSSGRPDTHTGVPIQKWSPGQYLVIQCQLAFLASLLCFAALRPRSFRKHKTAPPLPSPPSPNKTDSSGQTCIAGSVPLIHSLEAFPHVAGLQFILLLSLRNSAMPPPSVPTCKHCGFACTRTVHILPLSFPSVIRTWC